MYTLIAENYRGEQLQLAPNPNYYVEIDGITGATAVINTSVTGNSVGSAFNSSRTEEREIPITIMPRGKVEANRIKLYRFFQSGKPVRLYYKNESRDVYIDGYVKQSPEGTLFTDRETLEVSLLCPMPYWKSKTSVISDISDVLPRFTFPFAIEDPIPFSELEKGTEKTVVNNGDVESGVIIELQADGAVSDIVIYDEYGGSFKINYDMQAGDLITVNTYKGEKSIKLMRAGVITNLFKYVGDNPTWFNLEPGDNVFMLSATGSEFLQVRYINYNLYEGV